jgi:predicted ATPase
VCVIVDDVQWLDPASLDALRFAARRLTRDRVAVLVAARDGEDADVDATGVPQLVLGGLDARAGEGLLRHHLCAPIPAATARKLVAATAGNPLALVELMALCGREQLTDLETVELPLPVGPGIARAFSRRMDALAPPTRRGLSVTAVTESAEMSEIRGLLRRMGLDPEVLDGAERSGLLSIANGEAHFAHPLLRAVAYQALPAPERRIAHLAVAETIGPSGPPMRYAWHLALAVVEADEKVAAELEAAAAEARRGAAPRGRGATLRKAARLSPSSEERVRRLVQGAADFHLAGRIEEGVAMLAEASAHADDRLVRSDIEHLRSCLTLLSAPCSRTRDALVAQAEAVEALDSVRAAAMLLDASMVSVMAGQPRRALELAATAQRGASEDHGTLRLRADYCLGVGLLLCGQAPAASRSLTVPKP